MNKAPLLEIRDLVLAFDAKQILDRISFSLEPGNILSIIGPNGAGKTSLVRAVSKQLRPVQGRILVRGKDVSTMAPNALARQMAVVRQNLNPLSMSVRAYVRLGRLPFFKSFQFFETREDKALADEYMAVTGISSLAESSMDQISGGERQLAALARALTQQPQLLVLDEPTAHLDITHQARILDLLSDLRDRLGLTVLMVIHDLNLAAEYSDKLVMLDKISGQIHAQGPPDQVLTCDNIRAVYQTRVKILANPESGKPCIFLARQEEFRI